MSSTKFEQNFLSFVLEIRIYSKYCIKITQNLYTFFLFKIERQMS